MHDTVLPLSIPPQPTKTRLDVALTGLIPELSRTRLQQLIRQGHVLHQGQPILDPKTPVLGGEFYTVHIPPLQPAIPEPESIPLTLHYEDEHLLVLDKPAGLVVHPGAGNATHTLVNALLAHCGASLSGISGIQKPGIVHRLDKETSGLMVIAKHDLAHQGLIRQFSQRQVHKIYWAFVAGHPMPPGGQIDTLIARHSIDRQRMRVSTYTGKPALTLYRTLKTSPHAPITLLECTLKTGRTHQLRVHCAALQHPILGDTVYGRGPFRHPLLPFTLDRQALHARQLGFHHPISGTYLEFNSPLPLDLQTLYTQLF